MFTVSNDSLKADDLPNSRKKKANKDIPRNKQRKSYPAVLIGRLGVDGARGGALGEPHLRPARRDGGCLGQPARRGGHPLSVGLRTCPRLVAVTVS